MATAKIYHIWRDRGIHVGETGEGWDVRPYGNNTGMLNGTDDGGQDYILPDGYSVGQDCDGVPHLYSDKDSMPVMLVNNGGHPVIVTESGGYITLKRA